MTKTTAQTPEEIEQDIRAIRSNIDLTLDRLQRKLSPGQLAEQAVAFARDNSSAFASNAATMAANAGRAVRDNPLPVAMLCLGAAWLMFGGRREAGAAGESVHAPHPERRKVRLESGGFPGAILDRSDRPAHSGGTASSPVAGDGAERSTSGDASSSDAPGLVEQAAGSVRAAGQSAMESVVSTGARLRESAAGGVASARSRLGDSARGVQDNARRALYAANDYAQAHPLLVGAAMVAAGAALAALLPRTSVEDARLGAASERAKAAVRRTAEDAAERAGDAAGAAAQAFQSAAARHDLTPERARHEAAEIARGGSEAAKAAVQAARDSLSREQPERNEPSAPERARREEPVFAAPSTDGGRNPAEPGDGH